MSAAALATPAAASSEADPRKSVIRALMPRSLGGRIGLVLLLLIAVPCVVSLPWSLQNYDAQELTAVDTGTIKFGSLIGDCVKTAIGTMLNTGTVLDAGSNVFGGSPPRYLAPLRWGVAGQAYESDRFLADCAKIFARRKQTPPDELRDLIGLIN